MFPAFPVGSTCTSGAAPRKSTISKDAVFWPSRRIGLTELTSATGKSAASAREMRRQSSKLPRTMITWAPCRIAWASLPAAILPCGTRTSGLMPALAAYAAIEAEVFPVEAQTTALAPSPTATESATVMPRSLNEPVGLFPSTFSQTSAPVRPESQSECTIGVPPSPRVIVGVFGGSSRRSRYSSITPRHWCVMPAPSFRATFHPHHRGHVAHERHPPDLLDAAGQVGVAGRVRDHHELGVVAATFLADGLDGHVVLGEGLRHRGEHAGLVVDVDLHVVPGLGAAHRQDRQVGVRRLPRTAHVAEAVAGDGDQVAQDRARGRRTAGTRPVEHQLTGSLALHEDRVVGAAHAGQRVAV